jgi:5-methylthioadenosine/S-adenosylhomocysteine deaminase
VTVALGTDSPASGGDYDPRAEARACATTHAGDGAPSPEELLAMITLEAARALGRDDQVGALAPGRRADLLALRPPAGAVDDPVAAALDPAATVDVVAVDGEPLVRDGLALHADAEAIEARAHEARERLC